MSNENNYIILSYRKGEGIAHSYEMSLCEDAKTVLRSVKVTETNFKNFKIVIKGVQTVLNEIDSITNSHEERMNKNKKINRLETKLTIGRNSLEVQK